eukprot:CAMPEP_0203761606 /NCGR_PEP_ID=MMETSP0098-20131031/14649_1 /ASSEMBLY_ACC=CAM_ASM_000208 /TAXON_ID=96639 /ORGANISM=" , Strain NY0313808BC1" /LENGTH=331 /DNA_ID=CAMNT_0050655661 /DNA_START=110 /DNA_END=1105 /DNA_ORIENTATION=-
MPDRGGLKMGVYELGNEHVTLEWVPRGKFERHQVEMRQGEEREWTTLSENLKGSFMKKKNLSAGNKYEFRVKGFVDGKWTDFTKPLSVVVPSKPPLVAPAVQSVMAQDDGNNSILVKWEAIQDSERYEIQIRRMNADSLEWRTLSDKLKGNSVRKKNLENAGDYIFRVRGEVGATWGDWSLTSLPAATKHVNPSFKNLFGETLLRGGKKINTSALGGKIVGVYFSAHWCPPCRQQTAMMKTFYPQCNGLPFEIVFISADKSQAQFNEYFNEMPWLALPYDSPKREQIMQMYQVSGIPKLMIFSPDGKTITDNAAGVPLSLQTVNSWLAHLK